MLHNHYLDQAAGALHRRDYLTAMQLGMRAAGAPNSQKHLRCDAQMLLAAVAVELGAPEEALAYAVGAHLMARYAGDEAREAKAAQIVSMVLAHYPHLSSQMSHSSH